MVSGEQWHDDAVRLYGILDVDPALVAEECRSRLESNDVEERTVFAGLIVNAGQLMADRDLILVGMKVLASIDSPSPTDRYNHANALIALADLDQPQAADWISRTSKSRRTARHAFLDVAGAEDADTDLRSQALTNLGNQLSKGRRFVEAYDRYLEALRVDPTNGVAAMNAARELAYAIDRGLSGPIGRVAHNDLVDIAHAHLDGIEERAGSSARDLAEQLQPMDSSPTSAGDLADPPDPYEQFVVANNLHLSLGIEAQNMSLVRWDGLRILRYAQFDLDGPDIPPVFAMFNSAKQAYILARDLAFESLGMEEPSPAYYHDTLDYATYGPHSARLVEAFRLATTVMDQVAVAVNEVLGEPVEPNSFYFHNYWQKPEVKAVLADSHNSGCIALSEIAGDWMDGIHRAKRLARNTATHRFIVLHDAGGESRSKSSKAIDRYSVSDFLDRTIQALQLTRAALIHFVELTAVQAATLGDGPAVTGLVPAHHDIRGHDELDASP